MSLSVGDRQVYTCTLDGHLHRVTYTRYRIYTVHSPDDGHREMEYIYEKRIVRQVGYLQELNRDARSTEHKKLLKK